MRVQALYPIATVCVVVLSQTPAGSQPQSPTPVGQAVLEASEFISVPLPARASANGVKTQ